MISSGNNGINRIVGINIPDSGANLPKGKINNTDGTISTNEPVEEYIPVTVNLQAPVVEEQRQILVNRNTLTKILNQDRFIVSDENQSGFSDEEKTAILSGSFTGLNSRLNVCVHAAKVVEYYEKQLGWEFTWPSKFFTHYLKETDKAREKIDTGSISDEQKIRMEDFIKDLSRTTARADDSKVFINIASDNGNSMPSFNPAKLQITLTPYLGRNSYNKLQPHRETDAVAHETGHLANSCIRPGWEEAKYSFESDLETCAMREAFADLSAMFYAFDDKETCRLVLQETGGDLEKQNRVSRLSEEGGSDLLNSYFSGMGITKEKRYLRTLLNDYTYTEPQNAQPLPMGQPNVGELFRDVYSYSQIFSGALYDMVNAEYKRESAISCESADTLKQASGKIGNLFARAVELSPWWKPGLKDAARCLLAAEILDNKGENLDLYAGVLMERNLTTAEEVEKLKKDLADQPKINLADLPGDEKDAGKFLDESGLFPGDKNTACKLADRHTNKRGETFITYVFEKKSEKDPSETPFDMSVAILGDICDLTPELKDRASLVMKFDSEGSLVYSLREEYHTADLAQNYLKLGQ